MGVFNDNIAFEDAVAILGDHCCYLPRERALDSFHDQRRCYTGRIFDALVQHKQQQRARLRGSHADSQAAHKPVQRSSWVRHLQFLRCVVTQYLSIAHSNDTKIFLADKWRISSIPDFANNRNRILMERMSAGDVHICWPHTPTRIVSLTTAHARRNVVRRSCVPCCALVSFGGPGSVGFCCLQT